MQDCKRCQGYHYELIGCCSGHECGCMGRPVDAINCVKCNPDGKKEASEQARKDWPWFFLTKEELDKLQKRASGLICKTGDIV